MNPATRITLFWLALAAGMLGWGWTERVSATKPPPNLCAPTTCDPSNPTGTCPAGCSCKGSGPVGVCG